MRQLFSSIPGQVLDFMVVLIGIVVLFKKKLTTLVSDIFTTIKERAGEV